MSRITRAGVLDALEAKLREMAAEGELPDVITFAGNGEPTAAPEFPQAIAGASHFATSWPRTPRSPCSPMARALTSPLCTMRS